MTRYYYPHLSDTDSPCLLAAKNNAYVVKVITQGPLALLVENSMAAWVNDNHFVLTRMPKANIKRPVNTKENNASDVTVFTYMLHTTNSNTSVLNEWLNAYLEAQLGGGFDCCLVPTDKLSKKYKLACFDMDSTLIKEEVIDELAKVAGVGDQVAFITEQAMRGEIDFATSFAQRVALLKGLPLSVIDDIKTSLTLQEGAHTTIATLKQLGCHTALISGGFIPFAAHIAQMLGIDEYHANALEAKGGKLTGNTIPPLIDGNAKAMIVGNIAKRLTIGLDEVICVGDGANDLAMMGICGLSVAYRAKPVVQASADIAINALGLDGFLYVLGADTKKATDTPV